MFDRAKTVFELATTSKDDARHSKKKNSKQKFENTTEAKAS